MTQATEYTVVWYSPSRASNEGMYLVGTDNGLDAYSDRYFEGGTWVLIPARGSKYAMLDTAEKLAVKKCAKCREIGYNYHSIRPAFVDDNGYIDPTY